MHSESDRASSASSCSPRSWSTSSRSSRGPACACSRASTDPPSARFRDAGHDVHFVPGGLSPLHEDRPAAWGRVIMATAATPPGRRRLVLALPPRRRYGRRAGARGPRPEPAPRGRGQLEAAAHARDSATSHPHALHVDDIDILIPSDREPPVLPDTRSRETSNARLPAHASRFVPDGATLQTGIGGIPGRRRRHPRPSAREATTASTRRCSPRGS